LSLTRQSLILDGSTCGAAFFIVVAIVLAMLVFAFARRAKTSPGRWLIAFFPPAPEISWVKVKSHFTSTATASIIISV